MLPPTWLAATLGITGILMSVSPALAGPGNRIGDSPYQANADACPERCSVSGSNLGNWSVYPELKQLRHCRETVFYAFSVYNPVDNDSTGYHIHTCISFGLDFSRLSDSTTMEVTSSPVEASHEIGWWDKGFSLAPSGIRSLTRQARRYLTYGHGATERPIIIFAQSG